MLSKPLTAGTQPPLASSPVLKNLFDQTYEERWSKESFQKVVQAWKLKTDEQQRLMELKVAVKDVTSWKNNPLDLVRFMRSPGKSVEDRFREMIDWREKQGADQLVELYRPHRALLWYIPSAILKGLDKDGDPIYLERGGVMDGVGLLQHFDKNDIIKHIVWLREIATRGDYVQEYEQRTGRAPAQVTILYDMQGMSSRDLKALPLFKEIVTINQTRYCGLAKRIILLRAPAAFQVIWNIAKHFFPPEGRKLMIFTGTSNYQEILDKYIDREVLPPCICKDGKGGAIDCMPQNYGGGHIRGNNVEKTIPDEQWIQDLMNGGACPKGHRFGCKENTKTKPFPPQKQPENQIPPRLPPVCLSEYRNVKIMNMPQAQWQDEFETVLVNQ